jgi:outer membrane protein assembly factor BamB
MNLVNNVLVQIDAQPVLLVAIGLVGVILMIWAVASVRRPRRAIFPAIPGLVLIALAVTALIVGRDEEDMTRLAGVTLKVAPPSADDWPQWRGADRTGIGRAPGLRTDWDKNPPEILWKTPCGGGYSSFAIVGDSAITQDFVDGQERVLCLNVSDGKERWRHEYSVDYTGMDRNYARGPRATPTVHDRRIYTVGATGQFLCLTAENDKPQVLWQHDLLAEFDAKRPQWGVACSPLIEDDLVIVQPGGEKGTVAAFNRKTGDLVWSALKEETGYSSPMAATLAGVRQIVGVTGSRLVGLGVDDGRLLWSFDFPTRFNGNIATPLIIGDAVFVSASYNTGCALVRISGNAAGLEAQPVFRKKKLMRTHHMTCVFRDGFVYGCDDIRGDLTCLDLQHPNDPVWSTRNTGKGSIILAEGHLIVQSQDGTLSLVEATPEEYRRKGKMAVLTGDDAWALPALSRGRLFVRDHEKVVCLKVAD